jgi:hypothetical protein
MWAPISAPFLDHADADLLIVLRRQLFEPDRRGETRRAAADDQYVEFHRSRCIV